MEAPVEALLAKTPADLTEPEFAVLSAWMADLSYEAAPSSEELQMADEWFARLSERPGRDWGWGGVCVVAAYIGGPAAGQYLPACRAAANRHGISPKQYLRARLGWYLEAYPEAGFSAYDPEKGEERSGSGNRLERWMKSSLRYSDKGWRPPDPKDWPPDAGAKDPSLPPPKPLDPVLKRLLPFLNDLTSRECFAAKECIFAGKTPKQVVEETQPPPPDIEQTRNNIRQGKHCAKRKLLRLHAHSCLRRAADWDELDREMVMAWTKTYEIEQEDRQLMRLWLWKTEGKRNHDFDDLVRRFQSILDERRRPR